MSDRSIEPQIILLQYFSLSLRDGECMLKNMAPRDWYVHKGTHMPLIPRTVCTIEVHGWGGGRTHAPPPLACWPEPQQPDVPTVTVFAVNSDGKAEMAPRFPAAG